MSVTEECASLVLNTKDAVQQNRKTKCTWNNINLVTLLQGMYEKYDSFNICLNTIMTDFIPTANNDTVYTDKTDQNAVIFVSGLPFISNTYSTKTNTNTGRACLGTFSFATSPKLNTVTQYFYSSNIATFTKSCDLVSITIDLRRFDDGVLQSTSDYQEQLYVFDIYGVVPKTKLIDHRIKNL
jgi:hypothetical protein